MKDILKKAVEKPVLYSKNNIVTEVNNDFINLTGYYNNELIGKSLTEISNMLRIDSQVHLENIESEYSCYMFTKEYEPREVTISCKSLDCQNEKTYFIKEKPNSNIKEKFTYAEHLYSCNEIAIAIYSLPDLIVLRINDKYLEFVDSPYNKRETIIGKKKIEIMPGCKESNTEKIWLNNIKTGKPSFEKEFKYEHFERGTTYWDISLVPIFIDGKEKYLVETTTDVTEKVLNRKLVKKQKEELEAIIENMSDPLIFINKNGEDTMGSKTAKTNLLHDFTTLKTIINNLDLGCIITSYPDFNIRYINNKDYITLKKIDPKAELSSIVGKNVFDVFKYNMYEKTTSETNLQNLIEKESNSCFYYKKQVEVGEEKFLKIMCQPIWELNKVVTEIIFITIDITKEVKVKNKLEETLKIQDEMFSNISHELKTPLNVIFSTNQLMEFYLKKDSFEVNNEKVSNGINMIKQNCYRLTKLINNIIDISKIESGFFKLNLSNENIVNIIEDIVQSVSGYIEVKGLNIVFDTNTEEKIIACDPDKIERIILNLISNAIKFTNPSGSIFVNLIDEGDSVEISVKDTGIGMNKKCLDNIFKRFHQVDKSLSRNAEGSGIGLSLVKSIVELHGGKISAESKPDEGSIFKIKLPAKIIEYLKVVEESKSINSKVEMINVEFSDIYSI
jgi:signal transduction histidine kinase